MIRIKWQGIIGNSWIGNRQDFGTGLPGKKKKLKEGERSEDKDNGILNLGAAYYLSPVPKEWN